MTVNHPGSPTDLVSAGHQALARAAWEEARACFEAALGQQETPEALEGLGWAVYWLEDATATIREEMEAPQRAVTQGDHVVMPFHAHIAHAQRRST